MVADGFSPVLYTDDHERQSGFGVCVRLATIARRKKYVAPTRGRSVTLLRNRRYAPAMSRGRGILTYVLAVPATAPNLTATTPLVLLSSATGASTPLESNASPLRQRRRQRRHPYHTNRSRRRHAHDELWLSKKHSATQKITHYPCSKNRSMFWTVFLEYFKFKIPFSNTE